MIEKLKVVLERHVAMAYGTDCAYCFQPVPCDARMLGDEAFKWFLTADLLAATIEAIRDQDAEIHELRESLRDNGDRFVALAESLADELDLQHLGQAADLTAWPIASTAA